ncbi:kininogen-1-like [Lethenteron reissneri]|uniref:kininogen-1-like n=1 Tax=Lethenteron reissneri TaxID=7753 RepID=UPI002AB6EE61|nr:kininogen-1-like [Lethenteron reissneri]
MASLTPTLLVLYLTVGYAAAFPYPPMGGFTDLNPKSQDVKDVLDEFIKKTNEESDNPNWEKIDTIFKVRREFIYEIHYKATVRWRETECPKTKMTTYCATYNKPYVGKSYICDLDIILMPWKNYFSFSKSCY